MVAKKTLSFLMSFVITKFETEYFYLGKLTSRSLRPLSVLRQIALTDSLAGSGSTPPPPPPKKTTPFQSKLSFSQNKLCCQFWVQKYYSQQLKSLCREWVAYS